ncbi:hypothetical protein J6590_086716 [Homalodisca vitripennis]|nr:hypothetical protein J6590_086716 [Homalodisca vitripennis]
MKSLALWFIVAFVPLSSATKGIPSYSVGQYESNTKFVLWMFVVVKLRPLSSAKKSTPSYSVGQYESNTKRVLHPIVWDSTVGILSKYIQMFQSPTLDLWVYVMVKLLPHS